METPTDTLLDRTAGLDVSGVPWDALRAERLPELAVRTLHYMQDVESHTVVYARTLLGTRVVDEPEIATFLATWLYEESRHGLALERLLVENGTPPPRRSRARPRPGERLRQGGAWLVARLWADFPAIHMLWGAINELTTLVGYQRLARLAPHPALQALLAQIRREEARHYAFYYEQARRRLAAPRASRVAALLVRRFWAPVGSGVQPASEVRFLARTLFGGGEGREAARRIDRRIRSLPGLAGLPLLEAWLQRECPDP
jgi:rubrerythrin